VVELRGGMGEGVLDHRYGLLASGEPLQRVHRQCAEARRYLPERALVSAEAPDEHGVVVDDEPTQQRRAIGPGFVEVAGVDHGTDRARQALRTQRWAKALPGHRCILGSWVGSAYKGGQP
jgi:hypothetical protein